MPSVDAFGWLLRRELGQTPGHTRTDAWIARESLAARLLGYSHATAQWAVDAACVEGWVERHPREDGTLDIALPSTVTIPGASPSGRVSSVRSPPASGTAWAPRDATVRPKSVTLVSASVPSAKSESVSHGGTSPKASAGALRSELDLQLEPGPATLAHGNESPQSTLGSVSFDPSKLAAQTIHAPASFSAMAPLDDEAFAATVLAAARRSETGRFGDNKVFISRLFETLAKERAIATDLNAFKRRLLTAHFAGRLSLSRADLVEAMAPEDVEQSETQDGPSTFHFVRLS
jgi:hypothetical protein